MFDWIFCHIRNDGNGYEVSFFGDGPDGFRFYDVKPDAIFTSLDEAEAFAKTKAQYVNIIETPPFGF